MAARGHDQAVAVRAERVEDRCDVAAFAVDRDDVPLIRRCVADVAARRDDHGGAVDVERGGDLLVRGVARDAHGPRTRAVLGPVFECELVDEPVRRDGVDEAVVGVREWRRVRDLRAAREAAVAGRREGPEDAPAVSVDRERLAVGRRHDDHVVRRTLHRGRMDIDGRRVDGAGERDLLVSQVRHIGGRYSGWLGGGIGALGVQPVLRPFEQRWLRCLRARDGRARRRGALGGIAASAACAHDHSGEERCGEARGAAGHRGSIACVLGLFAGMSVGRRSVTKTKRGRANCQNTRASVSRRRTSS